MFTTMAPNDTFVSDGVPGMVCHRWTSIMRRSNYVPLAKNNPAKGSHVLERLVYGTHEKILLSETTMPKALSFSV